MRVLVSFVLGLVMFFTLNTVYAADATSSAIQTNQVPDIGVSRITPDSPLYFLKAVREAIEMKLAQTQRVKELRQLEFAIRRLREAKTLIGKNENFIPPTLERYTGQLSQITDNHQPYDLMDNEMRNNMAIHLKVLQQMYNQTQNLRTKLFIRSTMNRIIQRKDVAASAKLPVCNFFGKEASSSALNDTDKVVLKNRAQDCLKIATEASSLR